MSINFTDALKAKKIRDFFNQHGRIYIAVDTTLDDVQVPDFLKGDPALPLVLNVRMPQPIYIRDTVIESNFSFSGKPFACIIPMSRIWAMYLPGSDMSSGMIWDEDVPKALQAVTNTEGELIDNPDATAEKATLAPSSAPAKTLHGRQVRHLRVIK